MFFSITFLLSFICLHAVAGDAQTSYFNRSLRRPARILQNRSNSSFGKTFTLTDLYTGTGFLNGWDFFVGGDPTHGSVKYLSKADAIAKGLAIVQKDGTTVLAVDDKKILPVGAKRDSVRISTKKKYNGGLFIADFFAMPHGCSVWPAYWSLGPVWPRDGEIDILEGVHDQPTNQYTLHTSAGCTLSTGNVNVASKVFNKQCASSGNSNTGCGFIDTDTRTYGKGFNLVGGGVYVHLWNKDGIKVWHFARNEIPTDIKNKMPNPSSWGVPAAFWSTSSCDMASHFRDHSLVLDTTLCGDFAGATFSNDGCSGSCAQAVTDPKNYRFAKWKLNYIAVYQ